MVSIQNSRFIIQSVKCSHCGRQQEVKVKSELSAGYQYDGTIKCLQCEQNFDVKLVGPFMDGPYVPLFR